MRKDVKFGLAIGVILLVALVIYVFLVPAEKKGAPIEEASKAPATQPAVEPAPATQPGTYSLNTTEPTLALGAATQPASNVAISGNESYTGRAPTTQPGAGELSTSYGSTATGTGMSEGTGAAAGDNRNVDWNKILESGQIAGRTGTASGTGSEAGTFGTSGSSASVGGHTGSSSLLGSGSTTGQRTHVVKAGETLITIAQAEYGNGGLYHKILAANPRLDPRRMRVGQSVIIPDLSAAGSSSETLTSGSTDSGTALKSARSGKTSASIDPTRQYAVQPGDSLQRIASRLYGDSGKWEKLYELNKSKIGANPAHLRVGQVLSLPTPPKNASGSSTASSSSSADLTPTWNPGTSSYTPSTSSTH